ncbi:PEP-CTERM sorting domain-containing protein [Marinobacter salicampi]|uniref:PEP-CTERM sorting domain-containing protein n=1 Tax=Marinobacter salicampi TaxID=435907 RepID=UPI001F5E62BE|nr:PEP-CTERM sorting domain-containing protein [Marinobacter salicampi]
MNVFTKTIMCVALTAAASSASAAVIKFDAAYGVTNAQAAEASFLANSYNQETETFDGFANTGQDDNTDQGSWIQAASTFNTAVGDFTNTAADSSPNGDEFFTTSLLIENNETGEFGRADSYSSQWLDSNDADEVRWDILDGNYNAFGFFLSDANDQGAALKLTFNDGTEETLQLNNPLRDGNLMYITLVSDVLFSGVTLTFNNGEGNNDGWGIDNVTLASVPEPATLALLGLGLAGMTTFRRRK